MKVTSRYIRLKPNGFARCIILSVGVDVNFFLRVLFIIEVQFLLYWSVFLTVAGIKYQHKQQY